MAKNYSLSDEIDHYSDLRDKLKMGNISAAERKELQSIRNRMAI